MVNILIIWLLLTFRIMGQSIEVIEPNGGENYFIFTDYQRIVFFTDSIEHVDIKWNSFTDIERKIHYIPYYLDFFLAFNKRFFVTAVDFEGENNKITDFQYNPEKWIAIFFNREEIEIIKTSIY